tara:strand:+ start:518 stop:877 length:360 start_codon:yes stop_codon:yes gene_type:complete
MNRKEKFNQVEIVKRALIKAGLIDKVTIGAYLMENYVGKKTLHIKCTYDETFKSYNPAAPYIEKTTEKIEEINKYFSGRVFAAGIVQRKEWLLATPEERKAFMELNDGDIIACHPSNYK